MFLMKSELKFVQLQHIAAWMQGAMRDLSLSLFLASGWNASHVLILLKVHFHLHVLVSIYPGWAYSGIEGVDMFGWSFCRSWCWVPWLLIDVGTVVPFAAIPGTCGCKGTCRVSSYNAREDIGELTWNNMGYLYVYVYFYLVASAFTHVFFSIQG